MGMTAIISVFTVCFVVIALLIHLCVIIVRSRCDLKVSYVIRVPKLLNDEKELELHNKAGFLCSKIYNN